MSTPDDIYRACADLAAGRLPDAEGQGRVPLTCDVEGSRTRLISEIQPRARECPLLGVKQTSISGRWMSVPSQEATLAPPGEVSIYR